ncbi:MAG: hypothetical protein ACOZB3_12320 [Calditrichota bacterium]
MLTVQLRIIIAAILLTGLLGMSCKSADQTKSTDKATTQSKSQAVKEEIPPPIPKPASPTADELRQYVLDQQRRAVEIKKEIAALGSPMERNPEDVRKLLLKRKGELLVALKRIRNSDQLTPSQKDSLMKPLETESMDISTQMLAVSR